MGVYKIADLYMQLQPQTRFARELLKDYLVQTHQVDAQITAFPGLPEYAGLLQSISLELVERFDGMYIHGGALLYKGKVYLFTAPSGTGKSTHMAHWKALFGDQVKILNGDKPILRIFDGEIRVYGTPWTGKEGWGENISGPLGGIFLLKRGTSDYVEQVQDLEILNALLSATVYPEDQDGLQKLVALIGQLMERVPIRALYCTPQSSSAQVARQYIEGGWHDEA